jgi:NTP pyrophosphatase (non-canonical NTP hydrolase)
MITIDTVFEQAIQNHAAHSSTGDRVQDQRFAALALAGEAGELANFVKKEWRDGFDHSVARRAEIADCLAYTLLNAHLSGMTIADLLELTASKQLAFVAKMKARGDAGS